MLISFTQTCYQLSQSWHSGERGRRGVPGVSCRNELSTQQHSEPARREILPVTPAVMLRLLKLDWPPSAESQARGWSQVWMKG